MIVYKINILKALKNKGYSMYRIQKEKLFGSSIITKLNNNDTSISLATVNTLCGLLDCSINDILEYIPDDTESEK